MVARFNEDLLEKPKLTPLPEAPKKDDKTDPKIDPKIDPKADPKAKPKDKFDLALEGFTRNVTLGRWSEIKKFIASLEEEEGKALYKHLIVSLASSAPGPPR